MGRFYHGLALPTKLGTHERLMWAGPLSHSHPRPAVLSGTAVSQAHGDALALAARLVAAQLVGEGRGVESLVDLLLALLLGLLIALLLTLLIALLLRLRRTLAPRRWCGRQGSS